MEKKLMNRKNHGLDWWEGRVLALQDEIKKVKRAMVSAVDPKEKARWQEKYKKMEMDLKTAKTMVNSINKKIQEFIAQKRAS